jgi:hypothetical protein
LCRWKMKTESASPGWPYTPRLRCRSSPPAEHWQCHDNKQATRRHQPPRDRPGVQATVLCILAFDLESTSQPPARTLIIEARGALKLAVRHPPQHWALHLGHLVHLYHASKVDEIFAAAHIYRPPPPPHRVLRLKRRRVLAVERQFFTVHVACPHDATRSLTLVKS